MLPSYVKADLYRYAGNTSLKSFFRYLRTPSFRFMFFFRLLQNSKRNNPLRFVYKLLYRRYFIKYNIQIPISVKIGSGVYLPHFGGIVINSKCIIGKHCNILQNVTIGNTKRGKMAGAPKIGDKVYIGPSATVVGGVTIGDNVMIAPNAFVNFDVPSNSIVVGNPAKIISREDATSGYIENILKY